MPRNRGATGTTSSSRQRQEILVAAGLDEQRTLPSLPHALPATALLSLGEGGRRRRTGRIPYVHQRFNERPGQLESVQSLHVLADLAVRFHVADKQQPTDRPRPTGWANSETSRDVVVVELPWRYQSSSIIAAQSTVFSLSTRNECQIKEYCST